MPGLRSLAALAATAFLAVTVDARPRFIPRPFLTYSPVSTPRDLTTTTVYNTQTVAPVADTTPATSLSSSQSTSLVQPITSTTGSFSSNVAETSAFGTGVTGSGVVTGSTGITGTGFATGTGSAPLSSGTGSVTNTGMLRGVNIGSWLILEPWMNNTLFKGTSAVDQYTFDQTPGAAAKLQQHWSTFFTKADMYQLKKWGFNAVRIPIGYWAYDNTGTTYIQGADDYLDMAIGWAREYGMKVMVDCHGSPGSQNGAEHSGQQGTIRWQDPADNEKHPNLDRSISVLEIMAEKYGSTEYADVVFGLEITNEPKIGESPANNLTMTKRWTERAFDAVKAKATNTNLLVIMHDGFVTVKNWLDVSSNLNGNLARPDARFAMDIHLYQNQDDASKALNQQQHIARACSYWPKSQFSAAPNNLRVFVGEFTAGTDFCVNPDGSTLAGGACTVSGCQCTKDGINTWNSGLTSLTRQFVEAQIQTFEANSAGWFMWSYKTNAGAWSVQNIMKYVYGTNAKITDMMYSPCNSYASTTASTAVASTTTTSKRSSSKRSLPQRSIPNRALPYRP